MKMLILVLQLAWLVPFSAYADPVAENLCNDFFEALMGVPHQTLTLSLGDHLSLLDGKKHTGCQIQFITNDPLLSGAEPPDFRAEEGSAMYANGWRMGPSLMADGPGSSLYGIRRGPVLCLILHHQPAYLDEKTGRIIQTEILTITVQCREDPEIHENQGLKE